MCDLKATSIKERTLLNASTTNKLHLPLYLHSILSPLIIIMNNVYLRVFRHWILRILDRYRSSGVNTMTNLLLLGKRKKKCLSSKEINET